MPIWDYNATDGIVIAFSRYPGAYIYSNFSTTSTNEKYAGISTITNAAANDEYMVIGRFAATLSAGAAYTWTVPTFTAANLIQRPIYESRWLDWQPVGTNLTDGAATITAKYKTLINTYKYHWDWKFGAGSAVGNSPYVTMPWTNALVSASGSVPCGVGELYDSGTASYGAQPLMTAAGNTLFPVALGTAGNYANQALLTAAVPFTWAANDEMMFNGEVPY